MYNIQIQISILLKKLKIKLQPSATLFKINFRFHTVRYVTKNDLNKCFNRYWLIKNQLTLLQIGLITNYYIIKLSKSKTNRNLL